MLIYIVMFLFIVAADQVTKYFATLYLFPSKEKSIIDGVLSFTYLRNEGAAFGILQGARVFFIIITVGVLICAVYYIVKMRPVSRLEKTALAFISGGAIGNFIDRMVLGYVRDFIKTDFISFPVFNVADIFVCVGAGLYILFALFGVEKD